ncbi:thiamine pyrophosphate-dependent dehydrogenase E1 component subunit alpha [Chloroflexota bacterium]
MTLTTEQKIKLYTNMVRVRKLDELLVEVNPLSSFHSQQGQEAIGVGACSFLRKDDYLFHTHRGAGVCEVISKDVPAKVWLAERFGKVTGSCNGIAGFNTCDIDRGLLGMGGTVGGECTVAAGVGLAAKLKGQGQIVAFFLGDGTTGRGTLHEGMLMSANWKLPVVWLCSNNGMALWVPVEVAYPKENIADLAFGYGIPAAVVDGQDVAAVNNAVQVAVNRARAGEGPSFIEFKTCRFRTHSEGSPDFSQGGFRSEEEVDAWKKRDPIILFREKLFQKGILIQDDVDRIDREAAEEAKEAHRFAVESPPPDPDILPNALYAD